VSAHLIVLHRAVRALPGYHPQEAASIGLDGSSCARDTEHGRAVAEQLRHRHGTLRNAIKTGEAALRAAGVPRGARKQARKAAEAYFYKQLAVLPETELTNERDRVNDDTPLPEPPYLALRDLVAAIVERRYEDLRAASGGRLEVEDLRRRIEEDAGETLTMPPREHYTAKALMDSGTPGERLFFLDLWGEDGEADLHVAGRLTELENGQVVARLDDIAP
jgi:hypothetical protein